MLLGFWSALHSSWTTHDSRHRNRKTIITTEVLSFLSVEKSFTIFTLFRLRALIVAQRPMIIIANLKRSIRVKASRPLVYLYFKAVVFSFAVFCTLILSGIRGKCLSLALFRSFCCTFNYSSLFCSDLTSTRTVSVNCWTQIELVQIPYK